MNRCHQLLSVVALSAAVWGVLAQAPADPVADLFVPRPPLPAGADQNSPAPLRLPEAVPSPDAGTSAMMPPPNRPVIPRKPPFELKANDCVLFLGDAILEAEASHGYLETRIDSNAPTNRFTFRNLSASPNNPLRETDLAKFDSRLAGISNILEEVRLVKPAVVVLSFGTAPALQGQTNVDDFTNAYSRVLDALASLQPDAPPRLVLLSPLSFEPPPGGTIADVTNRNNLLVKYAEAVWRMATNRNTEFVDLFGLSRSDVMAGLRAAETGKETPRLTEDALHLTPYGSRRLVFALDRGFRWPGNNWRFGLMSDGQWRSGGFGAQIHSRELRDDYAKIIFTEERLPTPNLISSIDPLQESKPQYYMQVRGLKSGQYDLRVDRKKNLSATHEDWERFRIISHGPSWDQAEELRQLIVKKNQLWQAWMEKQRQAGGAGKSIAPDPQIAELEAKIAQFKRPVQRTYELVRVGDAPPPTNAVSQLPATPVPPAAPTPPVAPPAK